MDARERLMAVQAALKERGVRDIKFYFSVTAEKTFNHVATDVAVALEACLRGEVEPLPMLDDAA